MFDPIIAAVKSFFALIMKTLAALWAAIIFPFVWLRNLYRNSHVILKALLAFLLICIIIPYAWFLWNATWVRDFDLAYTDRFKLEEVAVSAGEPVTVQGDSESTRTCGRSSIVDVTADLIDFNVNRNSWISASLPYKLGLFGIPWDATPWFDNKASFQRGVHRAVSSAAIELQDALGRVRGTSQRDPDLNTALSNIQISEYNWYLGLNPFGPKQTAWSSYRNAMSKYGAYNDRLQACDALFDARADNLITLMDRVAKDIGSMSASIQRRIEYSNAGWFDTRADNLFMEASGQLYGYLGLLRAARADFQGIVRSRGLGPNWSEMEQQMLRAASLSPLIISNGGEDGFIMPSHLTTMGFYILRARAKLTEMRDTLKN